MNIISTYLDGVDSFKGGGMRSYKPPAGIGIGIAIGIGIEKNDVWLLRTEDKKPHIYCLGFFRYGLFTLPLN